MRFIDVCWAALSVPEGGLHAVYGVDLAGHSVVNDSNGVKPFGSSCLTAVLITYVRRGSSPFESSVLSAVRT